MDEAEGAVGEVEGRPVRWRSGRKRWRSGRWKDGG